jgi:two-component system, NarL family, response regulator NreC
MRDCRQCQADFVEAFETPASAPLRVVIADDHALVRQSLAAFLAQADLIVVGQATTGTEAYAQITHTLPDVAVLDVAMPGMGGIEVVRRVRDDGLPTALLLVSMHRQAALVRASLAAGANGYLLKDADLSELVTAIRACAAGGVYISAELAPCLTGELRGAAREAAALTPREREVLALLAGGLSNKEVAYRLGISSRTVEAHRAALMQKLDIHHLAGLVRYAIGEQLVALED